MLSINSDQSLEEQFLLKLTEHFGDREARSVLKLYKESKKDLFLNSDIGLLSSDLDQLLEDYPLQYLLGYSWFYNHQFLVNKAVLIPRPETEELVYTILQDHKNIPLKVLDIGTGSACIPLSLKAERPLWDVHALDISQEALEVAKSNAKKTKLDITLSITDILKESPPGTPFDLIVSNPPYIDYSEQKYMNAQVLKHEPDLALYADNKGLQFYERILSQGKNWLSPQGEIYFELNEFLSKEVEALAIHYSYQVDILEDMSGKERMARCVLIAD